MMNDQTSPINWQEVLKITNNKPELAKEMVAMLATELPEMKVEIAHLYGQRNYAELLNTVHKLHGSCCYCGVAKLKAITAKVESDLKQGQWQYLEADILALNNEIDLILQYISNEAIV